MDSELPVGLAVAVVDAEGLPVEIALAVDTELPVLIAVTDAKGLPVV